MTLPTLVWDWGVTASCMKHKRHFPNRGTSRTKEQVLLLPVDLRGHSASGAEFFPADSHSPVSLKIYIPRHNLSVGNNSQHHGDLGFSVVNQPECGHSSSRHMSKNNWSSLTYYYYLSICGMDNRQKKRRSNTCDMNLPLRTRESPAFPPSLLMWHRPQPEMENRGLAWPTAALATIFH